MKGSHKTQTCMPLKPVTIRDCGGVVQFYAEPTIGLDAVSKLAVRDFIKQLNQDHKTTVILTTHDMQDIEALTNRILLIGKGRILMDGSPEELKQDAASMDEAVVKLYRSFDEKEGR